MFGGDFMKTRKGDASTRNDEKTWLLHHDDDTGHTALSTKYLSKNNMVVLLYPHFSAGFEPCDFFLFAEFKMKLKKMLWLH